MKTTELLALLSRGFSLKCRQSKQVASLYNPAGEFAYDVQPEMIEELLSAGLISLSAEEKQQVYSLTEKARMLLSLNH